MKGASKDLVRYLIDFQFGVGVSGGANFIFHSANMVFSKRHIYGSLAIIKVYFSNAFSIVDQ